jgi:TetR/AcrR family transcriptional regulator, cholesterol catabolism regulator
VTFRLGDTGAEQRAGTAGIPSFIKDESLLLARRAQLIETATELFMARGYSEVSVNEIAATAGISIGSLYKYIRAKEDILWLVMDSIYGRLEELLNAERSGANDPLEALALTFRRFLHAVYAVRRGVLLMYREYRHLPANGQREFVERERRIIAIFRDILSEGNRSGLFHCPDPDLAAMNLLLAGHALSLKGWLLRDVSLEAYIEQQLQLATMLAGAAHAAPVDSPAKRI